MTLEDLKKQTLAERSDIKLDFEQFMRIFSFEKNRSSNVPTTAIISSSKETQNKNQKKKPLTPNEKIRAKKD